MSNNLSFVCDNIKVIAELDPRTAKKELDILKENVLGSGDNLIHKIKESSESLSIYLEILKFENKLSRFI